MSSPVDSVLQETQPSVAHVPINGFNLHELQALADEQPFTEPYKPPGGFPEPEWAPDCMTDGGSFFDHLQKEYDRACHPTSPVEASAASPSASVSDPSTQHDASVEAIVEVYKHFEGLTLSTEPVDRYKSKLDWFMVEVFMAIGFACDVICDSNRTLLDSLKQREQGFLVAVVLFREGDRRNEYLCGDERDQWRIPRFRDLFTMSELNAAFTAREPVVLKVILKISNTPLLAWTQRDPRSSKSTLFIYGTKQKGCHEPRQEVARVNDNKVIESDLTTGELYVWQGTSPRKAVLDENIGKVYPPLPPGVTPQDGPRHPFLTYNTFTFPANPGPNPNHLQISLMVRLVSHLHSTSFAGIELPAHMCIHDSRTGRGVAKLRSAIKKALNDSIFDLDAGKEASDHRRVHWLFDHGASKRWDIEFWVIPQPESGSVVGQYFYRWEGGNVTQWFRRDGRGQRIHVEAHFVPV